MPWWLPGVALLAWAVAFAIQAHDVARTAGLNSDNAAPFVLAGLQDEAPDGAVVTLGQHAWYEAYWLARLLEDLPGRDMLWQAAPFAVFALTLALVVWAVRAVAGGRAALLAVTALGAASTSAISFAAALNAHTLVALHAAFAAAALVLLVQRGGSWPEPVLAGWAVVVAAVTAVGGAGEVLVLPAVLVPLVAGATLAVVLHGAPRRLGVAAGLAAVHAGVGALLLGAALRDAGVTAALLELQFATASELLPRTRALTTSILGLGNGDPFGEVVDVWSVTALVAAAIVAAGLVWLARAARAAGAVAGRPPARAALAGFWVTAVAGVSAAYVLGTTATDAPTARYILTSWAGLCVLAALAPQRGSARALVTLAVTALAAISTIELARGESTTNRLGAPEAADAAALAGYVRRERLGHGYSSYWAALTTTWQTRMRAKVYPVEECAGRGAGLCPYWLHTISSWYVPRKRARTFIVVDLRGPGPLAEPPRAVFGPPTAVTRFGQLQVYVYEYDVAARFTPSPRRRPSRSGAP